MSTYLHVINSITLRDLMFNKSSKMSTNIHKTRQYRGDMSRYVSETRQNRVKMYSYVAMCICRQLLCVIIHAVYKSPLCCQEGFV